MTPLRMTPPAITRAVQFESLMKKGDKEDIRAFAKADADALNAAALEEAAHKKKIDDSVKLIQELDDKEQAISKEKAIRETREAQARDKFKASFYDSLD